MSSSQQPERVANKRKASEGGDSEAEQPPAAKRPNLEESAAEKLSRSSGRVISITKEPSDDAAQSQERGTLTYLLVILLVFSSMVPPGPLTGLPYLDTSNTGYLCELLKNPAETYLSLLQSRLSHIAPAAQDYFKSYSHLAVSVGTVSVGRYRYLPVSSLSFLFYCYVS